MDDKNTSTTLSRLSSKLTPAQVVSFGNILTLLLLGIVTIQIIWFRESISWYIYAIELILPIVVGVYHAGVYLLYRSWKEKHEKIASILGMTEADYYKQALDPERRKNFFELKLQKEDLNRVLDRYGERVELPQGVTWSEARKLIKQAEKRLVKTRIFAQAAGRVNLDPRDATYVRDRLAVANFQDACTTISAVRRRNQKRHAEAEKVLDKAREDLLSKLRDEIDKLPENFEQEILHKKLAYLEQLEFGTDNFWIHAHEIQNQILRFEIKTETKTTG